MKRLMRWACVELQQLSKRSPARGSCESPTGSYCTAEALPDQSHILLRRLDTGLRFLPENIQDIDHVRKPHRTKLRGIAAPAARGRRRDRGAAADAGA